MDTKEIRVNKDPKALKVKRENLVTMGKMVEWALLAITEKKATKERKVAQARKAVTVIEGHTGKEAAREI